MTPKEKAKELVDKFKNRSIELGNTHSQLMAEANALIAVDEMIEALKQTFHQLHKKTDMTPDLYLSESIAVHYYQEVKQEIENYNG